MRRASFKTGLTATILFISLILQAQQKEIVIDEDLAAHSEKMKVKMGAQWMGKIFKFKFGDYAVTDSKSGWTKTSSSSKFFSSKVESKSEQEFSFELSDKKIDDKALVNAATDISSAELQSFIVFSNFSIGSDELLKSSHNFSAFISTTSNEDDTWVLVKSTQSGSEAEYDFKAFLTNQDRRIDIFQTTSNKNGEDPRSIPAKGYEFVEDGKALCAMQYYGGGMLGSNKSIIWMRSELDSREQLILAAAMTALLQVDVTMTFSLD